MLNFLQRHPQVKLFLTKLPNDLNRYKGGAEFRETLNSVADIEKNIITSAVESIATPLDKLGYTRQDFLELYKMHKKVLTNIDGSTALEDRNHPLVKITDGKRATANQPAQFRNRIYFVGPCHYLGSFAPFDKTIESYLQQLLNEKNFPYRVENEGQGFAKRYQDLFFNLNKLEPAAGDIIFVWIQNMTANFLPSVDLSNAFDPPHDYRKFFVDRSHFNELGYKILAEKYFAFLTANNFFHDVEFNYPAPPPPAHRYGIPPQFDSGNGKIFVNTELDAYKQKLRAHKIPIGAIVMNCNPFTFGHLHLVESAASEVVKLYIFVVEEDASEFPFADRIELVRQNVKNFPNVEVIPSGKFIISRQTFAGYFNKAQLQDVTVDSSQDVEIFATEIAPTLGITIRFAGEEPTDTVTRRYNETMRKILPRHGIEFREIPRKTFGGEIISASTVRAALKRGDFDRIKNFVPPATFDYLRGRLSIK